MKYAQVPDDFKYSTSVAEATIDIRMAFIRKVYAILWVTFFYCLARQSVDVSCDG